MWEEKVIISILSIIMMLSSLWGGAYLFKYAKNTWAEMPYVLTCISICMIGFVIFITQLV